LTSYHCLNGVAERERVRKKEKKSWGTSLTSRRCIVFCCCYFPGLKLYCFHEKWDLSNRFLCRFLDFDMCAWPEISVQVLSWTLIIIYIIVRNSVPIVAMNTLITQYILYKKKLSRCNYFFSLILEAYRCITFDEKQTGVSIL